LNDFILEVRTIKTQKTRYYYIIVMWDIVSFIFLSRKEENMFWRYY